MSKLIQERGSLRKRIREEAGDVEPEIEGVETEVVATAGGLKKKARISGGKQADKSKKGKDKSAPRAPREKKAPEDDVDNVVYLGHVPNGFFETEIRDFFSQFGNVRRIKLFRSKKTGQSKGYAFVQFESMDVAVVASEAMDGYMFGDKKLVAHVVKKEKCHEGMFLPYKEKVVPAKKVRDDESEEKAVERNYSKVLRSDKKKMDRIRSAGIDF
jgi:nucleolar protein 15